MNSLGIDISLDERVAEVGQVFRGRLRREAHLDDVEDDPRRPARSVRLTLGFMTEGRGDIDSRAVSGVEVEVDRYGAIDSRFELPVPASGPISYDGRLMRVTWELEARLDIKLRRDSKLGLPVLVVPAGGWSVYAAPHPLR